MDKLYRFSPIETKEQLLESISYISNKTTEFCRKIIGEEYPISSLTIFSHYPDEFENLKEILLEMGELRIENNGPFVELHESISLPNNELRLLRVRKPDPYRMQVGCNDFEAPDYEEFKRKYLSSKENNLRLIKREDYEMVEFFDPDYDVLAYILSKNPFLI